MADVFCCIIILRFIFVPEWVMCEDCLLLLCCPSHFIKERKSAGQGNGWDGDGERKRTERGAEEAWSQRRLSLEGTFCH